MASNAPSQSTYSLGPRVSLDGGAPIFAVGECILVRIPGQIQVEGYVEDEASAIGTNLPPVSEGAGPQHLAFIREVHRVRRQRSFILEVYPILAFSNTGGAVATYNNMSNPATKAALLPLPLLSSRHPTPDAFGEPLSFGNWTTIRDSFLHVFPRRLTMPMSRSFKRMEPPLIMPLEFLLRIDDYREYLLTPNSEDTNGQSHHPPPNSGSGDEQDPPYEQTGDAGGQAKSGVVSVTSSPAIVGDGDGDGGKATEEGLALKANNGLLILEDVDEDAQDGDATTLDELLLLAGDNPMWEEDLRRYMQAQQKEKEWVQNERAARLALWRKGTAVELTC